MLADELPDLFEDFSSLPPRVTDSLPEDGAQVEVSRLRCGDTLGVSIMKPLDDEAAEAVSKGMAAATASRGVTRSKSVSPPSFSSPSPSSHSSHEDGSALMVESLMAATDCEVMLVYHSFFLFPSAEFLPRTISRPTLKSSLKGYINSHYRNPSLSHTDR